MNFNRDLTFQANKPYDKVVKRKLLYFFLGILILLPLASINPPKANAAGKCEMTLVQDGGADKFSPPSTKSTNIWFTVKIGEDYVESFPSPVNAYISYREFESVPIYTALGVHADFTLQDTDKVYIRGIHTDKAGAGTYYQGATGLPEVFKWRSGSYRLTLVKSGDKVSNPYCTVPFEVDPYCIVALTPGMDFKPPMQLSFKIVDFFPYDKGGIDASTEHNIYLHKEGKTSPVQTLKNRAGYMKSNGISFPDPIVEKGEYQIKITNAAGDDGAECKSNKFGVSETGGGEHSEDIFNSFTPDDPLSRPCSDANNDEDKGCLRIKTAFGYVRTDAAGFTRWILGFVLSISGGIVILIIIISGYRLMTSSGDPEKVKNARDQLTAAIVGLLFIIFSLALLELITRDILGLPGFGS